MKQNGFFNLILVLSFLLSSLGGITSNQTTYATARISWNIKVNIGAILDRIDSWFDSLRTDTSKIVGITPIGVAPTATPTHGFGIAPTIEPTRTLEPTLSQTLTPTATITPTLTPTEMITPTVTPTIQPTAQITETAHVTLTLTAEPELVYPGYPIIIAWKIEGWVQEGADDELLMTLPEGFTPISSEDNLPKWIVDGQTVRIPSVSTKGQILFSVAEDVGEPLILLAELHSRNRVIVQATLTLKEEGLTYIGLKGGVATGLGDRVKVSFPPNAVPGITDDNPLAVRVRLPTSKANALYYLSGMPFEIVAEQESRESGNIIKGITEFSQIITITVNYSGTQFVAGDESSLTLNYYDEEMDTWVPLTTYVDTQAKMLTAYTYHFTLFDVNAQNWEAARLPSLKDFQVAQFTGAASYSYPIEVPPGPGGLQPSLSLNYNSQSVDNASGTTQASWVGMGWSLETGYILRNQHGTMGWLEDDTYSLELNGQSSMLLKGTDGYYHTTGETFLRIQYDDVNNIWYVWDKSGTKYIFGDPDRASYPYFSDTDPCHAAYRTWKWGLSKIQNIYGKTLIYSYTKTTNQGSFVGGPCDGHTYYFDAAIYPQDIRYPNNYYRIYFDQVSTRTDYDGAWDQSTSRTFYQKNKLNSIKIQYNPDGDAGFNNLTDIRRYDLVYAQDPTPAIFPGYVWNKGGKTLTLVQIKEYGWNGYGPLPSTTFTYGDSMHMTLAENGYGGSVNFTYEAWNEVNGPESQILRQMTNQQYAGPCAYNWPGYLDTGGWGGASCAHSYVHPDDWWLYITGRSGKGIPPGLFHPGGMYLLHAELVDTYDNIQLGIYDGQADDLGPTHAYPGSIFETYSLPANASQTSSYLLMCSQIDPPTQCYVHIFEAYWLPTFYQVTQKTVSDDVTTSSSTFNYSYDEPATNDATHSISVATTDPYWRYTEGFSEFRGHAMTREVDPVGRVTTTFYDQGDARSGTVNTEIVGSESFWDDFSGSTLDTGNWDIISGANPQIALLRGDTAVNLPGDSNFKKIQRHGNPVTDNKAVLLQFQSSGSSNELNLGIESGSGPNYLNLGINIQADGSVHNRYCVASNCTTSTVLISSTNFHRDSWYVLLIILDDQGSYVRIWERDNPSVAGAYNQTMAAGRTWHTFAEAKNGSLWLDTYSEGLIYNLNIYLYDADSDAPILPDENARPTAAESPHPAYSELEIYWSRLNQNFSLDFEGDASFIAKDTAYEYNTYEQDSHQYGNTTRVIEWYYTGTSWVAYRLTSTGYFPYTDTEKYLVGLPGYTNRYKCPGGCDAGGEDVISSVWYLYDEHTSYSEPPDVGKMTGGRIMLYFDNLGNPYYADTTYTYDTWGNQTSVTQYSVEIDLYGYGTGGGARTTYTCYGGGGSLNGHACIDDGFHTYQLWERNALDQLTTFTYDKGKGVLTNVNDQNNIDTSATYDAYGRILTVVRSGDDSNNPTIRMSYHEASAPFLDNPFWTEAQQRITGSTYFVMRKYYNGMGQLLQTQVVGATIGTQTKDILTDTFYDSAGRVYQQTVPYDMATGSYYHVRSTTAARTKTFYDILSRIANSLATDGASTTYSYGDGYISNIPYLYTKVTNPRGYDTTTRNDIWGRVANVAPPTGPDVSYFYNEADKMTSTSRGGATTTLTYNYGGRKVSMNDPDMGTWYYAYDAIGNLVRQRDAKGQRTCLYYDGLNRLKGKNYRSDDNCPTDPGYPNYTTAYYYDEGGAAAYEIGRRTRMVDISGSTTWDYDSRGRLTKETKAITSSGTFVTQWGYNPADLPIWMKYPANNSSGVGEQVNFTYLNQMLVDSVSGTYTYVQHTDYDAAGRVDLRKLGADTLRTDYVYYTWDTQGGRLQYLKTGTPSDATSMQYFTYTYDETGNVKTILDAKNSNQKQCFLYDWIDRLTRGTTQLSDSFCQATHVGNGQYDESYTYDVTTGNLSSKGGYSLSYGDTNHKHAATAWNGWTYTYDANGNMVTRAYGGTTYTLIYDKENQMTGMTGGGINASFVYDGDGNRVQGTVGGVTTAYVGNYFEWTGLTSSMKKYYYSGVVRIAMRVGTNSPLWILGDHLGSTSKVVNFNGLSEHSQQLYKPWGEKRYPTGASTLPTTFRFTGQRSETGLGPSGGEGLMFYGSRWYDPSIMRFVQPDTVIPGIGEGSSQNGIGYEPSENYSALVVDYHEAQFLEQMNSENRIRLQNQKVQLPPIPKNVQSFDRYAYSLNNPVKYTDPSGHCIWDLCIIEGIGLVEIIILTGSTFLALEATQPGRPEAFAQTLYDLGEETVNGLQTLFSKNDWVPPGMTKEQRDLWGKAAELYKEGLELPPGFQLPKPLATKLKELIQQGLTPEQAADALDELEDSENEDK